MNVYDILSAISTVRAPAQPEEYDIHRLLSDALTRAGIAFCHECPVAPRRRVDFLAGNIAIEVKKGRPDRKRLLAQISGYLESDLVEEMVVVTQVAVSLPRTVAGKRVTAVSLNRLWGVALP